MYHAAENAPAVVAAEANVESIEAEPFIVEPVCVAHTPHTAHTSEAVSDRREVCKCSSGDIPVVLSMLQIENKWSGVKYVTLTVPTVEKAHDAAVDMAVDTLSFWFSDVRREELKEKFETDGNAFLYEPLRYWESDNQLVEGHAFVDGEWVKAFDFDRDIMPRVKVMLLEKACE